MASRVPGSEKREGEGLEGGRREKKGGDGRTQIYEHRTGHKATRATFCVVNIDAVTLEIRITLESTGLEAKEGQKSDESMGEREERNGKKGSFGLVSSLVPRPSRVLGKCIARTFGRFGFCEKKRKRGQ